MHQDRGSSRGDHGQESARQEVAQSHRRHEAPLRATEAPQTLQPRHRVALRRCVRDPAIDPQVPEEDARDRSLDPHASQAGEIALLPRPRKGGCRWPLSFVVWLRSIDWTLLIVAKPNGYG